MKKILLYLIISLSVFLISCREATETIYTNTTENQLDKIEPYLDVSFSYEVLPPLSEQYDPLVEVLYVNDTFELYQVRKLTSELNAIPYEKEFLSDPEIFTEVMSEIFDKIDTKVTYENQYWNILLGSMAQLTVYLRTDDEEFRCDFYWFEETNETAFRLYYSKLGSLLFYYDFGNIFEAEFEIVEDLL